MSDGLEEVDFIYQLLITFYIDLFQQKTPPGDSGVALRKRWRKEYGGAKAGHNGSFAKNVLCALGLIFVRFRRTTSLSVK